MLEAAPNLPSASRYHTKGRTAWLCKCDGCGRHVIIATSALVHPRDPLRHCGCQRLRPAVEPSPIATDPPTLKPAIVSRPSAACDAPLVPALPPLTAQQRLDGWHDSQLGRTRRICRPVSEDDEIGGVIFDFDPFE